MSLKEALDELFNRPHQHEESELKRQLDRYYRAIAQRVHSAARRYSSDARRLAPDLAQEVLLQVWTTCRSRRTKYLNHMNDSTTSAPKLCTHPVAVLHEIIGAKCFEAFAPKRWRALSRVVRRHRETLQRADAVEWPLSLEDQNGRLVTASVKRAMLALWLAGDGAALPDTREVVRELLNRYFPKQHEIAYEDDTDDVESSLPARATGVSELAVLTRWRELTESFDALPDDPVDLIDRQRALCEVTTFLDQRITVAGPAAEFILASPRIREEARADLEAKREEFRKRYAGTPSSAARQRARFKTVLLIKLNVKEAEDNPDDEDHHAKHQPDTEEDP